MAKKCPIVPIQKSTQLKLIALVGKKLKDFNASDSKFDMETLIIETFQSLKDKGIEDATAINFVKYIPKAIEWTLPFKNYLKVDVEALDLLERSFEDIDNVINFINDRLGVESKKVFLAEIKEETEVPKTSVSEPISEKETEISFLDLMFSFRPVSALSSTGQQGKQVGELTNEEISKAYGKFLKKDSKGGYTNKSINEFREKNKNKFSNFKKHHLDFYYDFLKVFKEELINSTGDPDKIIIGGRKGFGLKIVRKDSVPIELANQDDIDYVKGLDLPESKRTEEILDKRKEVYNKGIAVVLTDTNGKVLYLDKDYKSSEEGIPLYFNVRKVYSDKNKLSITNEDYDNFTVSDGGSLLDIKRVIISRTSHTSDSLRELEKSNKEEYNKLYNRFFKERQDQLQLLKDIRDKFDNTSDSNFQLPLVLTGASQGVLNIDYQVNTSFDEIDWENSEIEPIVEVATLDSKELKETKGHAYLLVPHHRSIPLTRKAFETDDVNTLIDLLLNPELEIMDETGLPRKLDSKLRQDLLNNMMTTGKDGIRLVVLENEYVVQLKGETIFSSDITKTDSANYTKESADKKIREFLNSKNPNGSPIFYAQFNIPNTKSNGTTTDLSIKDGYLNVENISLLEYVKRHAFINIKPNEGNRITFLNGYFTFDIDDSQRRELTPEKEYHNDIQIIQDNAIKNKESKKGAAKYNKKDNTIHIDRDFLKQKFKEKAWTKMRKLVEEIHGKKIESSAKALPVNTFKTYEEFEAFVIEHEYQHSLYTRTDFNSEFPGGSEGDYETIINERALEVLMLDEDIIPTTNINQSLNKKEVINKLDQLAVDGSKAKVKTISSGESHYEFLKFKLERQSNFVSRMFGLDKTSNEFMSRGASVGNYIDVIGRDIFNDTLKTNGEYIKESNKANKLNKTDDGKSYELNISDDVFASIVDELTAMRDEMLSQGYSFISEDIFVWSEYTNAEKKKTKKDGIGGVLDLLAVDSKGEVHIIDFKNIKFKEITSHASKLTNAIEYPSNNADSKINDWDKQQAVYKSLLEKMGIPVASTNILQVLTNYTVDNNNPHIITLSSAKLSNIKKDYLDLAGDSMIGENLVSPINDHIINLPGNKSFNNVNKQDSKGAFEKVMLIEELNNRLIQDKKDNENIPPILNESNFKDDEASSINPEDLYSAKTGAILSGSKKQIQDAEKWYKDSPLSKIVDFNTFFNIVNSNAFAEFTGSAINLYAGANATVLYHEAFHVFSQLVLSKSEKTKLYNSVIDSSAGRIALQKWADEKKVKIENLNENDKYLAIEELLAEDFRLFMMSGGTKVLGENAPIKKTIFQKLLDILKALFKGTNLKDLGMNKPNHILLDLYNNLRVGNVNISKASDVNHMFTKTSLYRIKPVAGESISLSRQDEKLVINSIDGLVSKFIDRENMRLAEHDASFTSALFTNPEKYLKNIYDFSLREFIEAEKTLLDTAALTQDPAQKKFMLKNANILSQAIKNFGDLNEGVFSYYVEKSPFLKDKIKILDNDAFNITKEDVETVKFDKRGDEISSIEKASNQVAFLIKSLQKTNSNGEPILNKLGLPELVNFKQTWQAVISILRDRTDSPAEMKKALEEEALQYPWVEDLLSKLSSVSTGRHSIFDLWTGFWGAYFTSYEPHYQMLIKKEKEKEKEKIDITFGQASGVIQTVKKDFKSFFKRSNNGNPYIIERRGKSNQLDYSVLDDFTNYIDNKVGFLNAIGIPISDNPKIIKEIPDNTVKYIHKKLTELRKANYEITDVIKILSDKIKLKDGQILASDASNINLLLNLEAKYSGNYSNSRITTPTNTTAYEDSQMSSLSRQVNIINKVDNYLELITLPEMKHLAYDNHSYVRASLILKELFEWDTLNKTFGKRKKGVKLMIGKLGGTQNSKDGKTIPFMSTSTADSDVYTRLMQDIYGSLLQGKIAGMTPADKGTINTVYVEGAQNKLYIEPNRFVKTNGISIGIQETFVKLMPYLNAELERIQKVKSGKIPNILGVTIPNKNGEQKAIHLTLFEGVFTDATRKKIETFSSYEELVTASSDSESKFSGLLEKMREEMDTYFNFSTSQVATALDGMGYFDKSIRELVGKNLNSKDQVDALLKAYTVNKFIHSAEQFALFYGDPSQYKDFDKRNSGMNSTGGMFRTDAEALNYVNTTLGRGFEEALTGKKRIFNGTLSTAIFREQKVDSALIPHYEKVIKKHFTKRFKKLGLKGEALTNAISTNVDRILSPYKGMEEGDAQGWLSFDTYRILSKLNNKWLPAHEKLYQKILTDPESVNPADVVEYFPPRKYQYFGPLESEGFGASAFHKYSLMPLIPNSIQGKNAELLHKQMMEKGIDYAIFNTGSKVSTITKDGAFTQDQLYEKDTRTLVPDIDFTPNNIHINYLKEQLDINTHYKNNVIFSTQLRKLIEEGMIEGGVPVDYKPSKSLDERRKLWDKETDKEQSQMYKMYSHYENLVSDYIDYRKAELKKEIGLDQNAGSENIEKLVGFIKKELERRDVAEHSIDFIKVSKSGKLVHDLSVSLSASTIERALVAIVNNRLVRQKVKGEPLIQTANTLFEKATGQQNEEFQTNDMTSYMYDESGTRAMDVKVSFQGDFKRLISLKHADGKRIGVYNINKIEENGKEVTKKTLNEPATLKRLNELIQDKTWRSNKENLDLITMVGVRIPVQGLNSMEFMVIKEFLPSTTGNIIIPPSEIVAKSGSDFDIDKLTIMMPSLKMIDGELKAPVNIKSNLSYDEILSNNEKAKIEVTNLKSTKRALEQEHRSKYKEIFSKGSNKELHEAYTELEREKDITFYQLNKLDDEILSIASSKEEVDTLSDIVKARYNRLKAARATLYHEDLLLGYDMELLEEDLKDSEIFNKEISSLKDQINILEKQIATTDSGSYENGLMFAVRDILAMPENFISLITPNDTSLVKTLADELAQSRTYKQTEGAHDSVNKEIRPDHIEFTRNLEPGFNMYKHESNAVGKAVLGQGAVDNTFNAIFNRVGAYLNENFGEKEQRITILMNHNKFNKKNVSLSHLYDANNKNKIADVINQLMNGWVDVAKDSWIFDIQGNKELTPTLLYLIQAGVNLETAVYFLSNPLIKEYASEQRKNASAVATLLNRDAEFYKQKARIKMLEYMNLGGLIKLSEAGEPYINKKELQAKTLSATKNLDFENLAYDIASNNDIYDKNTIAAFLHFLELEKVAEGITSLKTTLNYDTSKMATFYEAHETDSKIKNVRTQGIFPTEIVDEIVDNSIIGSFKIDDFMLELWDPLFEIRNNRLMNQYIFDTVSDIKKSKIIKKTFGTVENYVEQFKNDIIVKQFTDQIRSEGSDNIYRGLEMIDNPKEKSKKGVVFNTVNGKTKISINIETIKSQWADLISESSLSKDGNASIKIEMFSSEEEYLQFVMEREYQRFLNPMDKMKSEAYFKYKMDRNSKYFAEGLPLEVIEELTYNEILRDTALTKNLNLYQLFESDSSTQDLFNEILNMHPELEKEYDVVRDLINSNSKDKKYKNLMLKDNRLDGLEADVYHDNLIELGDVNTLNIETKDPIEKQRVADFFRHFSLSGFLQSGMDFKGPFTLGSILPQQDILSILKEAGPISDIDFGAFNRKLYYNMQDVSKRSRVKSYDSRIAFDIFNPLQKEGGEEDLLSPNDKPCNGGLPI